MCKYLVLSETYFSRLISLIKRYIISINVSTESKRERGEEVPVPRFSICRYKVTHGCTEVLFEVIHFVSFPVKKSSKVVKNG